MGLGMVAEMHPMAVAPGSRPTLAPCGLKVTQHARRVQREAIPARVAVIGGFVAAGAAAGAVWRRRKSQNFSIKLPLPLQQHYKLYISVICITCACSTVCSVYVAHIRVHD